MVSKGTDYTYQYQVHTIVLLLVLLINLKLMQDGIDLIHRETFPARTSSNNTVKSH